MANPSPICTVQDGAGAPQVTTNGANVTAGNVVTIALTSTAGVGVWSLTVVGNDDTVVVPAVTVNQTTKTATFTAPALPWALIFQSQVGASSLGKDINGQTQASYTTTFGVYCLTSGGARVFATNERAEGNASFGWITKVNAFIRSGGGGGVSITGSGLAHVTSGVLDAAAAHGTVAGQIPVVNAGVTDVAFVAVSGDATLASTGALSVVSLTGSAGAVSVLAAALTYAAGVTPTIGQTINATGAGVAMTVTAQAAKVGSAAAGGNLVLSGGAGDGAGAAGGVLLQAAGTTVGTVSTGLVTLANGVALVQTDALNRPATVGDFRVKNNWALRGRNAANTADTTIIQHGTSGTDLYFGDQTNTANTRLWGASSSGMAAGGNTDYALVTAASGLSVFSGGLTCLTASGTSVILGTLVQSTGATITPVNGANALSAAQSKQLFLRCLAGATAAVTLTSTVTPAVGNIILVKNETTQTITFGWSTGTGIAIPTATSMWVGSDGTNAIKLA